MRRSRTRDGAAHAPDALIATAWAAGREVDGPLPARGLDMMACLLMAGHHV